MLRSSRQSPAGRANFRFLISLALNCIVALYLLSDLKGVSDLRAPASDRQGVVGSESKRKDPDTRPNRVEVNPVAPVVRAPTCRPCDAVPELCAEIGDAKVANAMDGIGPNNRLRRALTKIRAGQPFNVAVLGGSASLGHGVPYGDYGQVDREPENSPLNMHRIIFDYLRSLAPKPREIVFGKSGKKEGKNGFINGSKAGTGSGYFAYCFPEHIPEDVDIVIVELGINDELLLQNLDSYEFMIRGVLDLPQKPAVIYAHIFNLLFSTMAFGGDLHRGLNRFYGIPTISLRDALLPDVLEDNTLVEKMFARERGTPGDGDYSGLDLRHISPYGHHITGQLVRAYIGMQLCDMESASAADRATSVEARYPIPPIPRMRIMQKWNPDTKLGKLNPSCYSMDSKAHPLVPSVQSGWRKWNWKEKFYWIADQPGSTISFEFKTVLGEIQLHYQRSMIYGLGNLDCWVDDDKGKDMHLQGWWHLEFNIAQQGTIRGLSPGSHTLNCQLSSETGDPGGGHEFRLIGLTSV